MTFLFLPSLFLLLTLTLSAQDQKSLVPIDIQIGGQRYIFYTKQDVTAQIELRETKIDKNNMEIRVINLQKLRVIDRKNLGPWEKRSDEDIKEYNRQIKEIEEKNKRYKSEISQLNRVLRRVK